MRDHVPAEFLNSILLIRLIVFYPPDLNFSRFFQLTLGIFLKKEMNRGEVVLIAIL